MTTEQPPGTVPSGQTEMGAGMRRPRLAAYILVYVVPLLGVEGWSYARWTSYAVPPGEPEVGPLALTALFWRISLPLIQRADLVGIPGGAQLSRGSFPRRRADSLPSQRGLQRLRDGREG